YPIIDTEHSLEGRVTRSDLISMIAKLDGQLRKEVHEVSFYADDFHGRGTAFGDTFDMYAITAAHRSFPSNTLVKVTNVENNKTVVVRINDRGPYVDGRDMDLSKAAFEEIAPTGQGVLRATFERLGHMDLVSQCEERQRAYQRRITRDTQFFRGVPHTFTLGDQLILQSNRPFVILGITFPDGQYLRIQDFVHPKEKYRISPDMTGRYQFSVGDTRGRQRDLRMDVSSCVLPARG
ncbi:MAG: septal ring lytic transglycosylase RlpA family protein, partial [Candidatus Peribacter sp.]|nr:septal ring lytic transglycosylase RlpA family protein [Candidatus Peribacter sp.]